MQQASRDLPPARPASSLDLLVVSYWLARLVTSLQASTAMAADRRDLEAGRFYAITDAGRAALAGAR